MRPIASVSEALLWIGCSALVACAGEPKPACLTLSTASYATKLIELQRSGDCADYSVDAFNADPEISVSSFFARDAKGQPDYHKGSVAIQTIELGTLLANAQMFGKDNKATGSEIYALGKFATDLPNDMNFCPAPTLSPAHLVLDALPAVADDPSTMADETFAGQPAVDIELTWSDVNVYLTAASVGSQVGGHLKDTRKAPDGSTCTVDYTALALAPAVPCKVVDDKGMAVMASDGTFQIDETLCSPDPDPSKNRFTGSGISVDVAYECDPTLFYCVVKGTAIPSLKD